MWLPQARTTWSNRHNPTALVGISDGTQYLALVAAVLWGVYALVTGAFWSGASGLVTAPLALATIRVLRRAQPDTEAVLERGSREAPDPVLAVA